MIQWALLFAILALPQDHRTVSTSPQDHGGEIVILVHGLMNQPIMMKKIEIALESEGYEVINWGYPSSDGTIEEHAGRLDRTFRSLGHGSKIHFVGFSLGSIVVRYYLTHFPLEKSGRFVMIAPPNHGSEIADELYQYEWFRWLYGTKSTPQLRASNRAFFETIGIPPVEFGIIAGGRGDEEGYTDLLPGDDDGTVSVESARLAGAKDFVLLNQPHTLLLFSDETTDNVVNFLQSGQFKH